MNISKNILSLGLITIISGISTAQTYTATAGTNGITDIQSDYSMSTGDGASVSVDVPLEFELPKKVAIAVNTGSGLPASSLFDDIVTGSISNNIILDVTPLNSTGYANLSTSSVKTVGGIYANTGVSVTIDATDFIHESDPNSIIGAWKWFGVQKKDMSTNYIYHYNNHSADNNNFPYTENIDDTELFDSDNKLSFYFTERAYLDTIDPTDRAGKYISTATITVSTL